MALRTQLKPPCMLCQNLDFQYTLETIYGDNKPVIREILIFCAHQDVCAEYDAKNEGYALADLIIGE